jgi:hypothetical protein
VSELKRWMRIWRRTHMQHGLKGMDHPYCFDSTLTPLFQVNEEGSISRFCSDEIGARESFHTAAVLSACSDACLRVIHDCHSRHLT